MKKLGNGSNNLDFFFGLVLVSCTHDVFCCCPRYVFFSFCFAFFFLKLILIYSTVIGFGGRDMGKKSS